MAIRQYVGARYVPRFTGLYDATQQYDALDVVDNGAGTSYIAKKTVPAGTPLTNADYWFVYGATSGAILNLENRMQTAEGDISNLQGRMTTAEGIITANTADILNNYKTRKKRNFILIGDSLGAGVVSATDPIYKGWYKYFKEKWTHGNVYISSLALPGIAGFASSLPFLQILQQDIDNQIADKNEITDIVVYAGTNDRAQTSADVQAAIANFIAYCRLTYPYARISIGVYGSDKMGLMEHVYDDYRTCVNYGVEFVEDLFNLICDPSYISSDGIHLTTYGYDKYNPIVAQAVAYGHCEYTYNLGFVADNSTAPTARFKISERGAWVQFCTNNSIYTQTGEISYPLQTEYIIAHYASLPRLYLPNNIMIAPANIYVERNNGYKYCSGIGSLKLSMYNGNLTLRTAIFDGGDAVHAYYGIPQAWYNINDLRIS